MSESASTGQSPHARPRLVVVGAAGSIGTALCRALSDRYDITAVTQIEERARRPMPGVSVRWRHCDLFSRTEMAAALAGADYGLYLVHARQRSARLDQAEYEDMEVIIADNFARAAALAGLRQTLCLRGLQPRGSIGEKWRDEVVEMLRAYGTPVTVLRASLVVAPGSTLVNVIVDQVSRGRYVPLPRWTRHRKQPLAIDDLVRAVRHCLGRPQEFAGSFGVGGPEVVDWPEILQATARLFGRRAKFREWRWFPRWLYRWWLGYRSPRTHPDTLAVLVRDLQFEALADDNAVQRFIEQAPTRCHEVLRPFVGNDAALLANPREPILPIHEEQIREARSVRSIQRITLPPGKDARWMAERYFRWLPRFLWPFVVCRPCGGGSFRIQLRGLGLTLLELTLQPDHSDAHRRMYFITGGVLASRRRNLRGRIEFHDVLAGRFTIIAIHDYAPSLPWNIYHATQAAIHGYVMGAFQRRMRRRPDVQEMEQSTSTEPPTPGGEA